MTLVGHAEICMYAQTSVVPSYMCVPPGKPVAAICHGPWLLCSAHVLAGKRSTCFHSIKDDVINAGSVLRYLIHQSNLSDRSLIPAGPSMRMLLL